MIKEEVVYEKAENIPIGSVIAEDMGTQNGVLLVKKGTVVDDDFYKTFKNYQGLVAVLKRTEVADVPDNSNQQKALTLSEEIQKQAEAGVRHIFSENLSPQDTADTAMDISNIMLDVVKNSDNLAISLKDLKVSDDYTFRHSVEVGTMSMLIGRQMQLPDLDLKILSTAGILHDLGKVDIPKSILNKPGRLTDNEIKIMQQHPLLSYYKIKDSDLLEDIKLAVLEHHENLDGSGYPRGLDEVHINKYAKVLAVADVYDALVTKRPYKDSKTPSDAIEIMYAMTNKFDAEIMAEFLKVLICYPNGAIVHVNNGFDCEVLRQNPGYPLRPVVKDLQYDMEFDLLNDIDLLTTIIEYQVAPDRETFEKMNGGNK